MAEGQHVRAVCLAAMVDEGASQGRRLPPEVVVEVEGGVVIPGLHHGIADGSPLDADPCGHVCVLRPQALPVDQLAPVTRHDRLLRTGAIALLFREVRAEQVHAREPAREAEGDGRKRRSPTSAHDVPFS